LPGSPGAGDDQNAVVRDLFDAPRRSAQDEGLAGLALEDHLLVQFADAHRLGALAGKEDAIESAIGDGAAVQNRDPLGAAAGVSQLRVRSQVMRGRSSANSSDG
jgi:hypothetical protein